MYYCDNPECVSQVQVNKQCPDQAVNLDWTERWK